MRKIILAIGAILLIKIADGQEFINNERDYDNRYQMSVDSILNLKKAVDLDVFKKEIANSQHQILTKIAPVEKSRKLNGNELYQHAKKSTVILGSAYLCATCDKYHINEASGYLINENGLLVTNYHVMEAYINMAPGNKQVGLFARLSDGRTYLIKQVAAASEQDDLVILKLDITKNEKLPFLSLAKSAEIGDEIAVMGHPTGMHYFFTQGYVNYKMTNQLKKGEKKFERNQMLISADYAVGSSGGPILNRSGNVVGTVSSTKTIFSQNDARNMQMVLKNTIPVESLWNLLNKS
jgi:S1-C subfamily serine protease